MLDHVRADLEILLAVMAPAHAHDLTVVLDELGDLGAHPALEGRKRLCLAEERVEKDRLRHPDRVRIPRRDPLERELADLAAVQAHLSGVQDGVRLGQDVLEEAELVEEMRGARLEDLAPELAIEGLVASEHEHVGSSLREQEPEEQAGGAAADDARGHMNGRHDPPRDADVTVSLSHACIQPDALTRRETADSIRIEVAP